jgi:alpha-L-rhamnosidase
MMISYNHYASGAVGDFLYRRIAGIEATQPGYKRFRVRPRIGGGLTHASAHTETPYGTVASSWRIEDGVFRLEVTVPMGTTCRVILPDMTTRDVDCGVHRFACPIDQ